jgi:dTDP-4-dehydrorhamnose 3,5-epimerase-like enzyme
MQLSKKRTVNPWVDALLATSNMYYLNQGNHQFSDAFNSMNDRLIGAGLGHGFISLEAGTAVPLLLPSPYLHGDEFEINPPEPVLGIDWCLDLVGGIGGVLSPKDEDAPSLAERARGFV